jgi:hypothetical protein
MAPSDLQRDPKADAGTEVVSSWLGVKLDWKECWRSNERSNTWGIVFNAEIESKCKMVINGL